MEEGEIKEVIVVYQKMANIAEVNIVEEETRFRDLFGKEELQEVRRKAFTQTKSYLEYLRDETERKLREQDGD